MGEKRCFTERIQQGTGKEEVAKTKERKKSQTMFGEERTKDFEYAVKKKPPKKKKKTQKNQQTPQPCIVESMTSWHRIVNFQGRRCFKFHY